MLGVPRKKITMWRWHRTKKAKRDLKNFDVYRPGMNEEKGIFEA
jgi:hypothetical protein